MIQGLSHITFVVKDIQKSAELLKHIFDADEVYSSDIKEFSIAKEKFLLIADIWICLMEGHPLSCSSYNHIAFKVDEDSFDLYTERIKNADVTLRPQRSRIDGEGRSIYFYDYDNHLFEIHSGTLEERLKTYANFKSK